MGADPGSEASGGAYVQPPASEKPAAAAPDAISIDVLIKRASAFYDAGHLDPALQLVADILRRRPDHIDALLTAAHALRELGRFDESLAVLRRIAKLEPGYTRAQAAYALTLFYKEDWKNAWRAYDVRFKLMDQPPTVTAPGSDGKPNAITPWRGGPIPQHLLVIGEQGLGDTIQFVRFLPLLTAAGAKVTCVVQQRLFRLLKTLAADIDLRPLETAGSVPGVKGWLPLMQLPQVLGLTPERFAPKMPYLSAEPDLIARRRSEIGPHGFKIGIAWQGNPDPRIDGGRSAPLSAFAPLADIPGVRLISLQKGDGVEQIADVPFAVQRLADLDSGPDGFVDTAAAMMCVDLVVTVDTSLAHLAGALARPTIVLLKHIGADWRWLFRKKDTAWYPTLRLFHQASPGAWHELLQRVAAEVRARHSAADDRRPASTSVSVPIAIGDLVDKITILEIKSERIADPAKQEHIGRELTALRETQRSAGLDLTSLAPLAHELKAINLQLWEIEDEIRELEARKEFEHRFIELARSVYLTNDRRALLKNKINSEFSSHIVEVKSYKGSTGS